MGIWWPIPIDNNNRLGLGFSNFDKYIFEIGYVKIVSNRKIDARFDIETNTTAAITESIASITKSKRECRIRNLCENYLVVFPE